MEPSEPRVRAGAAIPTSFRSDAFPKRLGRISFCFGCPETIAVLTPYSCDARPSGI
jgi:hypothetical protein